MEHNPQIQSEKIYSVAEITRLIKAELEAAFPVPLWVEGEISNFTRAHSGHLYFNLKDKESQLAAVMWRTQAESVPFELENGMQVVCKGLINVYERRGQYQFRAEIIEPKGKGALQLAFEQLKERLQKEGLFAPELKKELPMLPKRIGVVTSPKGAAIIDILRTLERRFARLHILIFPAKVQGEGAAAEIVEGIDYFISRRDVDAVIIGRGGGSIEDLWAFNEEIVARAIYRSPIPIISAVGHEVDFTISDFVADIRASTPTAAAEMVIEKEQFLRERIDGFERQIIQQVRYMIQERAHRAVNLVQHHAFQNFKLKMLNLAQVVDELEMRAINCIKSEKQYIAECRSRTLLLEQKVMSTIRSRLQTWRGRWERFCATLHNLSPLNILQKGYTLCWTRGGEKLARSINDVETGEELRVSFYQGEVTCHIDAIDKARKIEDRFTKNKGMLEE